MDTVSGPAKGRDERGYGLSHKRARDALLLLLAAALLGHAVAPRAYPDDSPAPVPAAPKDAPQREDSQA